MVARTGVSRIGAARAGISRACLFAASLAAALLIPVVAEAACYEDVGCTDQDVFPEGFLMRRAQCDILWEMRNSIYKERGYCFKTPRAIRHFGNAGCQYDSESAVPLSRIERTNAATIKRVEQMKGCL